MIDDTRPTLAERYACASETSNLRVKTDAPNVADVLIAAAFAKEPEGGLFARLRSEFDQAKAEVRREASSPQSISSEQFHSYLDRATHRPAMVGAGMYRFADGRVIKRMESEDGPVFTIEGVDAANERMLVMMRLKSLRVAKTAAGDLAAVRLWRCGMEDWPCNGDLTWQALSAWLDPTCSLCGGRGFTGGYDGPQIKCRRCDAGNRRAFVGKTDSERAFVNGLIGDIEEAVQRFEAGMLAAMRK